LLEPLLDPAALPELISIVSFWQNRSRIKDICTGLLNLSARVSVTTNLSVLENVCSINENTLGETCVAAYAQYRNQIEKTLPDDILTFIAYYSSSSDLFDFLHSLTADDVYNLQEAVNDWDETLVNTKTVFDFAIVKNFLDRIYAAMKIKREELKNAPLQLRQAAVCIENVWKDNQFVDLLKCLENVVESLIFYKILLSILFVSDFTRQRLMSM
jgi:hypothetical protein